MFKNFALAAAVSCMSANALESTMLDMNMYNDVVFAQTKSETTAEYGCVVGMDPICTLKVHSVLPDLDVPLIPSPEELPSFLMRRLERRHEELGEDIPEYAGALNAFAPTELTLETNTVLATEEPVEKEAEEPEAEEAEEKADEPKADEPKAEEPKAKEPKA